MACSVWLSACASTIDGAVHAPGGWARVPDARDCRTISGTYAEDGAPAEQNAAAYLYSVIWPVRGSLAAMIETGANGSLRPDIASIEVAVNEAGHAAFAGGVLVTRAPLGGSRTLATKGRKQ